MRGPLCLSRLVPLFRASIWPLRFMEPWRSYRPGELGGISLFQGRANSFKASLPTIPLANPSARLPSSTPRAMRCGCCSGNRTPLDSDANADSNGSGSLAPHSRPCRRELLRRHLREDGIVPLICPTCQNVFTLKASMPTTASYFAWGCFRYFGRSERCFGLAAVWTGLVTVSGRMETRAVPDGSRRAFGAPHHEAAQRYFA
jgi:hypothetical protein